MLHAQTLISNPPLNDFSQKLSTQPITASLPWVLPPNWSTAWSTQLNTRTELVLTKLTSREECRCRGLTTVSSTVRWTPVGRDARRLPGALTGCSAWTFSANRRAKMNSSNNKNNSSSNSNNSNNSNHRRKKGGLPRWTQTDASATLHASAFTPMPNQRCYSPIRQLLKIEDDCKHR